MPFYFVRHGETSANRQKLLAGGGLDLPLTPLGHEQAKHLSTILHERTERAVRRIWVSDMVRTAETARYLGEALGLPLEVHAGFREWHLGEWEGQPFAAFGHLILGDGEPSQGESRKVFYARVEQAWRMVHAESEPYLIVSHGAVWLALQDLLAIPRFKIENCDLVRVELRNGQWNAEILK